MRSIIARSLHAPAAAALLLLLVLLAGGGVDARRPGPRGSRRIRPTPEELASNVLPERLAAIPPPERSAVEPAPVFSALEAASEVTSAEQPPPSATFQPDASGMQAACTSYTEINIRPVRQQWDSGNGYCGEMSLQMTAMTRGIYISQKESRRLGVAAGADHPDLLFDERVQAPTAMSGVYGVAKMIGLDQPPETYWYSDNMTMAGNVLTPGPSAYTLWVKKNILQGRPVIVGIRVRGGGYPDYDHIMPIFGVCYTSAASLANTDTFIMTDDYMSELRHTPADRYFYAPFRGCGYTGCVPNDYYDYGVAVGPLRVPAGVYFPVKIAITAWSNNHIVSQEPGERARTDATAAYTLSVGGLTPGQTYRMYRTSGLFAGFTIPPTAAQLAATCAQQGAGCRSITFAAAGATMSFNQDSAGSGAGAQPLGRFPAAGVTYFLVVKA